MPREYERKSNRGEWTEQDLKAAFIAVQNEGMSVYAASKHYSIPERTLRRRIQKNDDTKHSLGPKGVLGTDVERKLATHIKKLQAAAFSPTVTQVRILAYKIAERYNLKHRFNQDKKMAGYDWFYKFLKRNPDIVVRKSEGLSLARAQGLTKEDAENYFDLLKCILIKHNLMDKPSNIYNVDETGLPLNNKPGFVLAEKGSKDVHYLTSGEKGESITAIVCCNAEGNFLPPVCIFKGVNKKAEWEDQMPPGSSIVMSQKSAYVTTDIFTEWLENHFIPRKAQGKVVLILDGHTSHTSATKLLELAAQHDIELLCLPSHSTHYLQPLDRCFFKSLKHHWFQACQNWMDTHSFPEKPRKLGRAQVGELLTSAWRESANSKNGISCFQATGIYPFDPSVIPDRAFIGSANKPSTPPPSPQPSTSFQHHNDQSISLTVGLSTSSQLVDDTPTKVLQQISPVPTLGKRKVSARRQDAQVLTSPEVIAAKQLKFELKKKKKETSSKYKGNKLKKALDNTGKKEKSIISKCTTVEYKSTTRKYKNQSNTMSKRKKICRTPRQKMMLSLMCPTRNRMKMMTYME